MGWSQDKQTATLLFMGDIMGHDTQINSARVDSTGGYDYRSCFKYIDKQIKTADLAIANLEVTLAGPPHKGYPQFSSPDELVDALQLAGVDVLVTSNNHCVDRRRKGLERTASLLDKKGIPRTGTFINMADKAQNSPLKFEINGIRLALLNYTYGTNGIRVESPNIVHLIDTAQIAKDIAIANEFNPDQLIVFVHWGLEYQTAPNSNQKRLYRFLRDKGVQLIIGSHPHVVQPIEWHQNDTTNHLVVYSMGNFISNQRTPPTDGGAMVRIKLTKNGNKTAISDAGHILTWVYTPNEHGKKRFYVLPVSQYENSNVFPTSSARKRMKAYAKEAREVFKHNINVKEITINRVP